MDVMGIEFLSIGVYYMAVVVLGNIIHAMPFGQFLLMNKSSC